MKNRKRSQKLASGIAIRQDFHACARMVFYETGDKQWRHATHGGTAFVVVFKGRPYGFTCKHVLQDFEWRQLIITNTKLGRKIAGLQAVAYPTQPHDAAADTDIVDIVVIEFTPDVTGLSGAPVYNARANALCGMVVRGGMQGSACTIMYFDIFDMMKLLAGVHDGLSQTFYRKRWMPLRTL